MSSFGRHYYYILWNKIFEMFSNFPKVTQLNNSSFNSNAGILTPQLLITRSRIDLLLKVSVGLGIMILLQTLLVNENLHFSWWSQDYILLRETNTKPSYTPSNGPLNLQFVSIVNSWLIVQTFYSLQAQT